MFAREGYAVSSSYGQTLPVFGRGGDKVMPSDKVEVSERRSVDQQATAPSSKVSALHRVANMLKEKLSKEDRDIRDISALADVENDIRIAAASIGQRKKSDDALNHEPFDMRNSRFRVSDGGDFSHQEQHEPSSSDKVIMHRENAGGLHTNGILSQQQHKLKVESNQDATSSEQKYAANESDRRRREMEVADSKKLDQETENGIRSSSSSSRMQARKSHEESANNSDMSADDDEVDDEIDDDDDEINVERTSGNNNDELTNCPTLVAVNNYGVDAEMKKRDDTAAYYRRSSAQQNLLNMSSSAAAAAAAFAMASQQPPDLRRPKRKQYIPQQHDAAREQQRRLERDILQRQLTLMQQQLSQMQKRYMELLEREEEGADVAADDDEEDEDDEADNDGDAEDRNDSDRLLEDEAREADDDNTANLPPCKKQCLSQNSTEVTSAGSQQASKTSVDTTNDEDMPTNRSQNVADNRSDNDNVLNQLHKQPRLWSLLDIANRTDPARYPATAAAGSAFSIVHDRIAAPLLGRHNGELTSSPLTAAANGGVAKQQVSIN